MRHALLPVDKQRVGFTVDVLLERHPGLLQVGQGHPGFAQLLAQRGQGGVELPRLSFQAASASPGENTEKDREGFLCLVRRT